MELYLLFHYMSSSHGHECLHSHVCPHHESLNITVCSFVYICTMSFTSTRQYTIYPFTSMYLAHIFINVYIRQPSQTIQYTVLQRELWTWYLVLWLWSWAHITSVSIVSTQQLSLQTWEDWVGPSLRRLVLC